MTLLAIVAIHTAANEPPKVRQVMTSIHRNVGPRRHVQDVHPASHPLDEVRLEPHVEEVIWV